jgi:hypothetical protein
MTTLAASFILGLLFGLLPALLPVIRQHDFRRTLARLGTRRFVSVSRVQQRWWAIVLNSGHEEHRPFLSIVGFGFYVALRLPKLLIQPHRRKVIANWDPATVDRMGRDWYWDETRREFGISFYGDRLSVLYGVQPDAWPGDKRWSWQLPWARWRCIESRWLDLLGRVFERVPDRLDFEASRAAKDRAPKMVFAFNDFDGERIEAAVRLEEFEHARGAGRWAWLDRILARKVGRRYDIEFSKETGPRKGSWKGGMRACNGPEQHGELHEATFRRFAAENRFTNIERLA